MSFSPCVEVESKGHPLFELCRQIRMEVFVDEQGVDEQCEMDEIDEYAQHFLITWGREAGVKEVPVATMRIFRYDLPELTGKMILKLGRIAVVQSFRKHGLGKKLLEAAERYAISQASKHEKPGVFLYMHSQSDKQAFYKKFGYSVVRSAAHLDGLIDGKLNAEPHEEELNSIEFMEDGILHVRMAKYVPCMSVRN